VDDATCPLFLGESDLLKSVLGHLWGNGQQRALEPGATGVGEEPHGADLSVGEGNGPLALLLGGAIAARGAGLGAQGAISGLVGEGVGAGLGLAASLGHDRDVLDAVAELVPAAMQALGRGGRHGDQSEEDNRLHDAISGNCVEEEAPKCC